MRGGVAWTASIGMCAGLMSVGASAGALAASLDAPAPFDIPAQALDTALLAYSRQSGIQIIAASEALSNK
jgi:hypothetical protein